MILTANLVEQVHQILRERIISLRLGPGQKIDVPKLAKEFGISATPIRDALKILHQTGLVDVRPRVGHYVVDLAEEDIADIYDLRKMFEVYALEGALENIHPHQIRELRQEMKRIPGEVDEQEREKRFREGDRKLHLSIIRSFPNKRLQNLFSHIYDLVEMSISLGVEWEKSLEKHIALLDALEGKELSKAKEILIAHIDDSRSDAIEALKRARCQETI